MTLCQNEGVGNKDIPANSQKEIICCPAGQGRMVVRSWAIDTVNISIHHLLLLASAQEMNRLVIIMTIIFICN